MDKELKTAAMGLSKKQISKLTAQLGWLQKKGFIHKIKKIKKTSFDTSASLDELIIGLSGSEIDKLMKQFNRDQKQLLMDKIKEV